MNSVPNQQHPNTHAQQSSASNQQQQHMQQQQNVAAVAAAAAAQFSAGPPPHHPHHHQLLQTYHPHPHLMLDTNLQQQQQQQTHQSKSGFMGYQTYPYMLHPTAVSQHQQATGLQFPSPQSTSGGGGNRGGMGAAGSTSGSSRRDKAQYHHGPASRMQHSQGASSLSIGEPHHSHRPKFSGPDSYRRGPDGSAAVDIRTSAGSSGTTAPPVIAHNSTSAIEDSKRFVGGDGGRGNSEAHLLSSGDGGGGEKKARKSNAVVQSQRGGSGGSRSQVHGESVANQQIQQLSTNKALHTNGGTHDQPTSAVNSSSTVYPQLQQRYHGGFQQQHQQSLPHSGHGVGGEMSYSRQQPPNMSNLAMSYPILGQPPQHSYTYGDKGTGGGGGENQFHGQTYSGSQGSYCWNSATVSTAPNSAVPFALREGGGGYHRTGSFSSRDPGGRGDQQQQQSSRGMQTNYSSSSHKSAGGYYYSQGPTSNNSSQQQNSMACLSEFASRHGLETKFTVRNVDYSDRSNSLYSSSDAAAPTDTYDSSARGGGVGNVNRGSGGRYGYNHGHSGGGQVGGYYCYGYSGGGYRGGHYSRSGNNAAGATGGHGSSGGYYGRGQQGYATRGSSAGRPDNTHQHHNNHYGGYYSSAATTFDTTAGAYYGDKALNAASSYRQQHPQRQAKTYTVTLEIGGREYTACGRTSQQAKQLAAARALEELQRQSGLGEEGVRRQKATGVSQSRGGKMTSSTQQTHSQGSGKGQGVNNEEGQGQGEEEGKIGGGGGGGGDADEEDAVGSGASGEDRREGVVEKSEKRHQEGVLVSADGGNSGATQERGGGGEDERKATTTTMTEAPPPVKPDITQVYEYGHRMGLPVVFEEQYKESAALSSQPQHRTAKVFTVTCKIGDEYVAEAEAVGKKSAHRAAARKMLQILPPLPPSSTSSFLNGRHPFPRPHYHYGNSHWHQDHRQHHPHQPHYTSPHLGYAGTGSGMAMGMGMGGMPPSYHYPFSHHPHSQQDWRNPQRRQQLHPKVGGNSGSGQKEKERGREKEKERGELNPVSRLVQILQTQRAHSPVFTVCSMVNSGAASADQRGGHYYAHGGRRGGAGGGGGGGGGSRHFHVDVRVGEERASGFGGSRKAAKRQAAVRMLRTLGYTVDMERQQLLKDGKVVPEPLPNQNKCSGGYKWAMQQSLGGGGGVGGMLDRTFEEAVLAAATAMGLHGCLPPLLLQQQHTSSTLSAKGNKTASQSGEQAGGKDVGKETADGSKEEAEGQGEGSSGEDSQDMMDERAGYVAATDFGVLAHHQALLARELLIKHRYAQQRRHAIDIAKELLSSSSSSTTGGVGVGGWSVTAATLIKDSGRTVAQVVGEGEGEDKVFEQTQWPHVATEDEDGEEGQGEGMCVSDRKGQESESRRQLSLKQQMKLLCGAVGAHLSYNDHTKVGPPLEHVSQLRMVLGKQFLSEGQSSESVGEAQERASQSALEMIANADPSGPHIPIPPLASTTTCPLQTVGEGAESIVTVGEVKGRLAPGKSEGEMGTTSDDKGEDSGYVGRAAQSEDTRSHNSQDVKERGNSQLQTVDASRWERGEAVGEETGAAGADDNNSRRSGGDVRDGGMSDQTCSETSAEHCSESVAESSTGSGLPHSAVDETATSPNNHTLGTVAGDASGHSAGQSDEEVGGGKEGSEGRGGGGGEGDGTATATASTTDVAS